MDNDTVFMFSGQGSQYYNMGIKLYNSDSIFCNHMNKLDEIFSDITGCSVVKHLYDNSRKGTEVFDDIFYTHPAIFMVEYSLAQLLMSKDVFPDYVLGASLGEYAACAVANVMSCEDTINSIVKQVNMLKENCLKGGMLAVIDDYKLYNERPSLYQNSDLISVNYDSHFVVAGGDKELNEIGNYLKANNILCVRLPVPYAFHSSWIDPICEEYIQYLMSINLKDPQINFVSCMTGGVVKNINYEHLWKVIRKPMKFINALKCLDEENDFTYIDVGPSGTLGNFVKYHIPKEKWQNIFPIMTPFHNEEAYLNKLYENTMQIAY